MRLKVLLPSSILLDAEITDLTAPGDGGRVVLHEDGQPNFFSLLVPGVLAAQTPDGGTALIAISRGTLVRCADRILVTTQQAAVTASPPAEDDHPPAPLHPSGRHAPPRRQLRLVAADARPRMVPV